MAAIGAVVLNQVALLMAALRLRATLSAFGDHEAALTLLDQALRVAQRAGDRATIARVHRHLANVSHEAGRTEAWAEIGEALRGFEGAGGFAGPCQLIVGVGRT